MQLVTPARPPEARSKRWLAVVLSLGTAGLGHVYAGQLLRALLIAVAIEVAACSAPPSLPRGGTVARSELLGPVTQIYWSWDFNGSWTQLLDPLVWWDLLATKTRWDRVGAHDVAPTDVDREPGVVAIDWNPPRTRARRAAGRLRRSRTYLRGHPERPWERRPP
jgi:hypothetical protein